MLNDLLKFFSLDQSLLSVFGLKPFHHPFPGKDQTDRTDDGNKAVDEPHHLRMHGRGRRISRTVFHQKPA